MEQGWPIYLFISKPINAQQRGQLPILSGVVEAQSSHQGKNLCLVAITEQAHDAGGAHHQRVQCRSGMCAMR